MPDRFEITTANGGSLTLNRSFRAVRYDLGGRDAGTISRRDRRSSMRRRGDGLNTPEPYVLEGVLWTDDRTKAGYDALREEAEDIRDAVRAARSLIRSNDAGSWTITDIIGGAKPEFSSVDRWEVACRIELWPVIDAVESTPTGTLVGTYVLVANENYNNYADVGALYPISVNGVLAGSPWPIMPDSSDFFDVVAVDEDGGIYLGSADGVRKVATDGTVTAFADDADGGLESVGNLQFRGGHLYASSYTSGWVIAKYEPDLTVVWRVDPPSTGAFDKIVVDSNGDLYATHRTFNPAVGVKKFSGVDGSQITNGGWQSDGYLDFDHQPYGIAIDGQDRIVMVGHGGASGSHAEMVTGSDATRVWRVDPTETGDLESVTVDADGNPVVSDGVTLAKLASADGATVWSLDDLGLSSGEISRVGNGVADADGNTYWTAVLTSGSDTAWILAKVDRDGSVQWRTTYIPLGSSVDSDNGPFQAAVGSFAAGDAP